MFLIILFLQSHIGIKGRVTDLYGDGIEHAVIDVDGITHYITTGNFLYYFYSFVELFLYLFVCRQQTLHSQYTFLPKSLQLG